MLLILLFFLSVRKGYSGSNFNAFAVSTKLNIQMLTTSKVDEQQQQQGNTSSSSSSELYFKPNANNLPEKNDNRSLVFKYRKRSVLDANSKMNALAAAGNGRKKGALQRLIDNVHFKSRRK
jgi:hypothetical protein